MGNEIEKFMKRREEENYSRLKCWEIFLDELLLNLSHQDIGSKKFLEFIVASFIQIQKALVFNDSLGNLFLLHQVEMAFINYPELTFFNNYTLEMREVKIYDNKQTSEKNTKLK